MDFIIDRNKPSASSFIWLCIEIVFYVVTINKTIHLFIQKTDVLGAVSEASARPLFGLCSPQSYTVLLFDHRFVEVVGQDSPGLH